MKPFIRTLVVAGIAGGMAITGVPALAQDSAPDPTVYRFALPGSVKAGATKFTLPGDLITKKSRGDKALGSLPLADVVVKLTRLKEKGYSVGGAVTINGKVRETKGIPVILADGTVKVRVAQARGSRTMVLPRRGGSSSYATCVPGYYTMYNLDGTVTCIPIAPE